MKRALLGLLVVGAACTPIEPVPISNAPLNTCGCDAFGSQVRCNSLSNRCESGPTGARPSFPFFLTVSMPDAAFFAAANTFVLYSDQTGNPAFGRKSTSTPGRVTNCKGPSCVEPGALVLATNEYLVSAQQSFRVGYPMADGQRIPARVEYEPIGPLADATAAQPDFVPGLPLDLRFVPPQLGPDGAETVSPLPAARYRRVMYPEPPFDQLFPPRSDAALEVKATLIDAFTLTSETLDPVDTRSVTVKRQEGLDGWQVWVADSKTKRRISTLKTLSGTSATLVMDTTGERRGANNGLGDTVEVVVAPPASFVGIPRFVNPVNGGDLGTINYPFVFAPVPVAGVVAEPNSDPLLGYSAFVSFESASIATPRESSPTSPLLHYSTSLATDDHGRFATVLPPGTYDVTVEPAPGTGFAKSRQIVVINREVNGLTLQPPKRTIVRGRVVLTDERPMAEADILATPQTPASAAEPKPRPNQTQTGPDGRFTLELDQGPYVITAIPKAGTGFPRIAIPDVVPADDQELSEIRIPPPIALSFSVHDPSSAENPVQNALVRVFAVQNVTQTQDFANLTNPQAIEIGNGTTDLSGQVEILLAPEPP